MEMLNYSKLKFTKIIKAKSKKNWHAQLTYVVSAKSKRHELHNKNSEINKCPQRFLDLWDIISKKRLLTWRTAKSIYFSRESLYAGSITKGK